MTPILTYLMLVALGATVVVLVLGILNLFLRKEGEGERSNKLMQWRVAAQVTVLILFTFILLLGRKG
ncbi:MAG: twin transmembrane helix small protein [Caedimonas sp.]|nr:twin transmembrane helix small protein [Caedimonas sp.]